MKRSTEKHIEFLSFKRGGGGNKTEAWGGGSAGGVLVNGKGKLFNEGNEGGNTDGRVGLGKGGGQ